MITLSMSAKRKRADRKRNHGPADQGGHTITDHIFIAVAALLIVIGVHRGAIQAWTKTGAMKEIRIGTDLVKSKLHLETKNDNQALCNKQSA